VFIGCVFNADDILLLSASCSVARIAIQDRYTYLAFVSEMESSSLGWRRSSVVRKSVFGRER